MLFELFREISLKLAEAAQFLPFWVPKEAWMRDWTAEKGKRGSRSGLRAVEVDFFKI